MIKGRTLELREAFGSFMTGVTVVTTSTGEMEPLGFTANSFSSVSLEPALLLVSIAKTSSNYKAFAEGKHFAINVLAEEQRAVSNTFASKVENRFANVDWSFSDNKNPIIKGCSAWFDCVVHSVVEAGDHSILIGEIKDFDSSGLAGLGYYRGAYFSPAKLSTEAISAPKVMISAVIGHQDEVLLVQNAQGAWGIPQFESGEGGAQKTLDKIFAEYEPGASANFIYSIYDDFENNCQHIVFLCNSPSGKSHSGQYINLNKIDQIKFIDQAVFSILSRYKTENALKNYGVYYGSQEKGIVRQTMKEEK